MQARIVATPATPGAGFPRWGYLDKYSTNEYMARSFALTLAATLCVGAVTSAWMSLRPASAPTFVSVPTVPWGPVDVQPPPIVVAPHPVPAPGHRIGIHSGRLKLVPVLDTLAELETGPAGSGTATGPDAAGPSEPAATGSGIVESETPAPDPEILFVVEKQPELVTMRSPIYPEIAREAGVEGTVLVRVLVGSDGTVRDASVIQSVLGLDEAAIAAAVTAVFRPAMQQERAVATWVVVPIEFRLHD